MKGFIFGVIIGVLLVVGSVGFYFFSGRAPVATTDKNMPFEGMLARNALVTPADDANAGSSDG